MSDSEESIKSPVQMLVLAPKWRGTTQDRARASDLTAQKNGIFIANIWDRV
jgi:hypothetical protein